MLQGYCIGVLYGVNGEIFTEGGECSQSWRERKEVNNYNKFGRDGRKGENCKKNYEWEEGQWHYLREFSNILMSQIGGIGYENGNYNSKYILKTYYMPGTFLSDLQVLTQWILTTATLLNGLSYQ